MKHWCALQGAAREGVHGWSCCRKRRLARAPFLVVWILNACAQVYLASEGSREVQNAIQMLVSAGLVLAQGLGVSPSAH